MESGGFFKFDYSKDDSTTKERSEEIYQILLHSEKVKEHAQSCNTKFCKVCIKIDFLARIIIGYKKLENKEFDYNKLFENDKLMDEYFFTDEIISPVAIK